jgi:aminobenzoyl-glutamate utilization protein A
MRLLADVGRVSSERSAGLIRLRRDLHEHPEPGWCEFYTTARVVEECEAVGADEVHVGPDLLAGDRLRPPDRADLDRARERASAAGVDDALLARMEGGYTGALAVLRRGEGPTVGLRVDIDALPQRESDDPSHAPAAEGFRSRFDDAMHACGHDAHAAIGVGVLDRVAGSDEFAGTLKLFFQPAEEVGGGAAAIVGSGHLADVDALYAVHVGLDEDVGTVFPGIESFLAVNGFTAAFEGAPAHAGISPHEGANAVRAMATAVDDCYGVPRHGDGATRVNVGPVEGGTASNVVPESAAMEGEVRGATTALRSYMEERVEAVLERAAAAHGCTVDVEWGDGAPSAECDPAPVDRVADAAARRDADVVADEGDALGGSEDATRLMRAVQRNGGTATYVGVGASNPSGHHTARFDVDERAIPLAVDVLADAILATADADAPADPDAASSG